MNGSHSQTAGFDEGLLQELRAVFAGLNSKISFHVFESAHEKQAELVEFLSAVASTSDRIEMRTGVQATGHSESSWPTFQILIDDRPTGVSFLGIPTGHEFTSLVVAVLNADQKGRLPDAGIQNRIRSLKGPILLRTFISLTCENCPDVVQALNQMALIHPNFEHQMVDGAFRPDEIDRLKIQGVPSVWAGDQLLSSGKISFVDLLAKLESHFGMANEATTQDLGEVDVAVIGAGPAGASAAIYLARKGLKTAILAERLGGQVQDTLGIENLISVPYTEGPQLTAKLHEHLKAYPIQVLEHRRVAKLESAEDGWQKMTTQAGEVLRAKSVLVSTGAQWRQLQIPGEKEYIGRGVAFCPHCDGPYYRGKKVAVIGGGNSGVEAAIDLAGIVREVVLIEYGPKLKADQVLVKKLESLPNATVVLNTKSKTILGDGTKVQALEIENLEKPGTVSRLDLDGIFVQIGLVPNSQFLKGLIELTPQGEVMIDAKGRTSQKGIYAAGDVTTVPFKQIVIAMGEGAKTALTVFEDLMLKA